MRRTTTLLSALLLVGGCLALGRSEDADALPAVARARPHALFQVAIDGVAVGGFKSVDGLSAEVETVEYRDGGDNLVRKLPGRLAFGSVTLVRDLTKDTTFFDWIHEAASTSGPDRKDVTVTVYDPKSGDTVRTFNLVDCFPTHLAVKALDAKGGGEVAIEEIVLAVENVSLD